MQYDNCATVVLIFQNLFTRSICMHCVSGNANTKNRRSHVPYVSIACLAGLQAHSRGGGKLRGLAWGGLQAQTQGGELRGLAWGVFQGGRGSPGPHPGGMSPGPYPGESPGPNPGGGGGLQAHTQSGGIPACTEAQPPADGYCCGWYASYWNAFLLNCVYDKIFSNIDTDFLPNACTLKLDSHLTKQSKKDMFK